MKYILLILLLVSTVASFGQTKLIAKLTRNSSTDTTYGLLNDSLIIGGHMTLSSIANRDAIPFSNRNRGMFAVVNDTVFILKGGISNANWQIFTVDTSKLVPKSRTISINGVTKSLDSNITFTTRSANGAVTYAGIYLTKPNDSTVAADTTALGTLFRLKRDKINADSLNGQLPSYYLNRTYQTGTQPIGTITGLSGNAPISYSSGAISADTGRGTAQLTTGYDLKKVRDSVQANIPTNYLTTNTTETVTAEKTFNKNKLAIYNPTLGTQVFLNATDDATASTVKFPNSSNDTVAYRSWVRQNGGGGGGGSGKVYSGYGLLNVGDSMLKADTTVLATVNALNLKLNIGDTASMLSNYKSAIITNTAVSRSDYYRLNQLSDSSIAIISYDSTRRDTLVFGSGNGNGMVYATTTGGNINQPSFRTALGLGSAAYKEANQNLRTTDGVIFDYVRLTNGIDGVIAFGNTGKVLYSNANTANTELIYRYSGDGTTSAFDYTVLTGKNFVNYTPTLNGNNIPVANRDSFGINLGLKSNAYTTVDSTTITNTGGVLRAVGGGSGVSSITGTANQVLANSTTGSVTLSLPQSIATTSKPTFSKVTADSLVKTGADSTAALMGNGSTLIIKSGTYTPTPVPSNNCASVSLINATYQRIGNVVTFNINMNVTPTSGGSTINTSVQSISVPIPFSAYNTYYAIGVAKDTVTDATVAVSSSGSSGGNSVIVFQAANNNVQRVSVTFTYTGTP